jgi:hypothetical protein
VVRGCPPGWGEPCFDKLEAKLAHAMLSIPATKGFEIGSGFSGVAMRGTFIGLFTSPRLTLYHHVPSDIAVHHPVPPDIAVRHPVSPCITYLPRLTS